MRRQAVRGCPEELLQCVVDHGSRGAGGGAQAPRHVHRIHRRARAAPPDLGGRGQRRRRGDGRLRHARRGRAAGRRRGPGGRRRPRHPGRHAPGREAARHRGRHDRSARRRQVRQRLLRGLRRAARRRRLRRQRPVRRGGRGDPHRRSRLAPALRALGARARCARARPRRSTRQHGHVLGRPRHLRDHRLQPRDDPPAPAGDGLPQQGPHDRAARRAQRQRPRRRGARRRGLRRQGARARLPLPGRAGRLRRAPQQEQGPHPQEAGVASPARAPGTPSRSRCSGTPATPSRSTRSRTRSTPTRAARTRRASARR